MLEFLSSNMWAIWLVVALAFLLLESGTAALICIWFVPAAIIVSVLSVWIDSLVAQIAIFIVLSGVCLFLCKKLFAKSRKESLDDTSDKLIGKTAKAQTVISDEEGKVLIGDVYWRATADGTIEEGETVVITEVNGNVLTVCKK